MEDKELLKIIERVRTLGTDSSNVEIKEAGKGLPAKIWSSVSAFANSNGGLILLGLSEQRGFTYVEGFEASKILNQIESGLNTLKSEQTKVKPVPRYSLDFGLVDGKSVVTLKVERLDPAIDHEPGPCYVTTAGLQGGSYKRVSDKDTKLSSYEIYLINSKWSPPQVDQEVVEDASTLDFDSEILEGLYKRAAQIESRIFVGVKAEEQGLQRLQAVNRKGEVTLAGILALGEYPQQFFPQLFIDVSVHPSNQKGTAESVRFVDRQKCDGPIPLAINDAVKRVALNLRKRRVVQGVEGQDYLEIPETVLREAITNAAMHRDYSSSVRGQQIAVDVYPDRVEITNPGGLWGDRTIENLFDGRSSSRNEALVSLLGWTPMSESGGVVAENQGSGILFMRDVMHKEGLPTPRFETTISSVKVILDRHGVLVPDTYEWLKTFIGETKLGRSEELVLALAKDRGEVSVKNIREILAVDSDEARELLGTLLEEGFVAGRGDGPYVLIEKWYKLTSLDEEILDALNVSDPMKIRDLAESLNRTVETMRPAVRRLVEAGFVIATAPPTSRNRAYLKASNISDF